MTIDQIYKEIKTVFDQQVNERVDSYENFESDEKEVKEIIEKYVQIRLLREEEKSIAK